MPSMVCWQQMPNADECVQQLPAAICKQPITRQLITAIQLSNSGWLATAACGAIVLLSLTSLRKLSASPRTANLLGQYAEYPIMPAQGKKHRM